MNFALPLLLLAVEPPATPDPVDLEPMVVVSTLTPRPAAGVAGMATVIDAVRFEFEQAFSLGDLTRYEVGIEPESGGTRFGETGLSIRGIGGNRVAIEVDGVGVGDRFAIGSYSNAGHTLVDPELLQRAEILRGAASTLYGSDAIGGVAALFTWEPAHLLAPGKAPYRLRAGYDSATHQTFASALGAFDLGSWQGLGAAVHRAGEGLDHAAASGRDDRIDSEQSSALLRLGTQTAWGEFDLIAEGARSDRVSKIESLLGQGRFRATTALAGDDQQARSRVQATWRSGAQEAGRADFDITAYLHRHQTDQATFEERASRNQSYQREFTYQQGTAGLEAHGTWDWTGSRSTHRIGFGLDLARTQSEEMRDGILSDLDGRNPTREILGEQFPLRDFPKSTTLEAGLWIQDEIEFEAWTVIPGLRLEHYRLDPRTDPVFLEDNPSSTVVALRESQLTPKLGVLRRLDEHWTAFGQYARGFRAPPFEDANVGLDIPLFNIRAVPNPDLKSEISDNVEIGLRYRNDGTRLEVLAFHNRYRDFITTRARIGVDPADGTLLFQSRNIESAKIEGLELRARQALTETLTAHASAYYARGEDQESGLPLASVSPPEAILGLAWTPNDDLTLDLRVHGVRGQRVQRDDGEEFLPAGYATIDVLASWKGPAGLGVALGAFNLADQTAWRWTDVRGLDQGDQVLPLLSRPGRHFSATFTWRW